jgi:hypothetical protein
MRINESKYINWARNEGIKEKKISKSISIYQKNNSLIYQVFEPVDNESIYLDEIESI